MRRPRSTGPRTAVLFGTGATAGNVGASFQLTGRLTEGRNAARLARSLIDRLHQVLKVGKDVGVGFMAMLGYHFPIDDYVELTVGSWG